MKAINAILIFLLTFSLINSLYIYIEPRENTCLTDFRYSNSSFDIVYYVSGQEEERNIATLEDQHGNLISKMMNKKTHKFSHKVNLEGAKIAVIGRSNTVGSPLAKMLTAKNAVVTLCHSKTKDLKQITLNSDIVVSAVGKENLIEKDFVKKGTILIDVATIVNDAGKCVGDIDFENLKEICPVSPVPGGVGPVTLACLLENIIISAERKIK